jgi:cytochrome c biogenesis protein CcmG, thiol:disulfide interchange protein DsbE
MRPSDKIALSNGGHAAGDAARRHRSGLLYLLPVALFVGLIFAFGFGLDRDPSTVPSPLIGKPVPEFSLAPVKGRAVGLSSADLKGEVSVVNVFASWCVPCREEHPLLIRLKEQKLVPIDGINYKDKPDDAARWLDAMGDPYNRTGADLDGRVAIDWGVYGVPETYAIDRDGRIVFKQIGPITSELLDTTILPLLSKLKDARSSSSEAAKDAAETR